MDREDRFRPVRSLYGLTGESPDLMDELRGENQTNPPRFENRDRIRERCDGLRMRMPDGNCRTATKRILSGEFDLRSNRAGRNRIIKKYSSGSRTHPPVL